MSLFLPSKCLVILYGLFSSLDVIKERLADDPTNQNVITRSGNWIRNTRTPDKVIYYHLNIIDTVYTKYERLLAYSGNENDISHNKNRLSNTMVTNKGLSPPNIAPTAYIRYVRILGTQYLFGKPIYNTAG